MLPQPLVEVLSSILLACCTCRKLLHGFSFPLYILHVQKHGLFHHRTLRRCLVCMLAESGNMDSVDQRVLEMLTDEALWESMLTECVANGNIRMALLLYQRKDRNVAVRLNPCTFVALLKACSKLKDLACGICIHSDVDRTGLLRRNLFVGSTLIDMYAKFGCLEKAEHVFYELPVCNTVTWNALISGYVELGHSQKALQCLQQMQLKHVHPDAVTFTCALKACASTGATDKGREIHAMIEKQGLLQTDIFLGNSLLGMYAKFGFLMRSREVFDRLLVRDVVSWSALITGYAEHGHGKEALICFEEMQLEGVSPDAVTFLCNMKACSNIGTVEKGHEIHSDMEKRGLLQKDIALGNTLVDLYAKCGSLLTAGQVFSKLLVRNVVSWNTLITGYAEHEQGNKALQCLEKMQEEGISPNTVTFLCCLKACGNVGAVDKGQEIHAEVERQRLIEKDLVVGNTIVDMYARCGLLDKAHDVFDMLPKRDIISWTTLMSGHAYCGESKTVFFMFDRMKRAGIKPNPITFVVLLSTCSRECLISKCETYFETINKDYGMMPMVEHHACIVGLLGRSGQLQKAVEMVLGMPLPCDIFMWHAVLDACRNSGNAELGKQAFEHALCLNDKDPVAYILMSQISAY